MNEQLIKKFTSQCGIEYDSDDGADDESLRKYTELIVRECIKTINFECKDFANGNCFNDVKLWESVTREYGSNKERDFDPVGMGIHFENKLKQHFGVEE